MTTTEASARAGTEPFVRRADIQGLRAVAVLLVVLFHADLVFPGGFVGVDTFFVISGYVIAGQLLREVDATGSISLPGFYARRIRRLLPALALLLVTVLVLGTVLLSANGTQQWAGRTAIAASFFSANIELYRSLGGYFAPVADTNPFLHLWSLGVEEQLYLVVPAGLLVLSRLGNGLGAARRRLVMATGVVVASVASLALCWVWSGGNPFLGVQRAESLAFYGTPARLWEMGAGILLALLPANRRLGPRAATGLGVLGLLLVLGAGLRFDQTITFPAPWALVPVAGAVLLLASGDRAPLLTRLLSWRGLTWIGDRSYAWYLWHWPLIVLATATWPDSELAVVAAAAFSLVPTALSYRLVEQPIHVGAALRRWGAPRLAGVCIAVPVAVALVVIVQADVRGTAQDQPSGNLDQSASREAGCHHDLGQTDPWPAESCTFGVTEGDAQGTVLLLGDSHADSISDAVVEAGNQLGYDVAVFTHSGCPFLASGEIGAGDCAAAQQASLDLAARLQPDLVVTANKATGYRVAEDGRAAEWQQGVEDAVSALEAAGTDVLVVAGVPLWPSDPVLTPGWRWEDGEPPPLPTDELTEARTPVAQAEAAAVAGHPDSAATYDPVPALCTDVCHSVHDGTWTYYDANHLTPAGSLLLVDSLRTSMSDLLEG